jgi:hypothetical protein
VHTAHTARHSSSSSSANGHGRRLASVRPSAPTASALMAPARRQLSSLQRRFGGGGWGGGGGGEDNVVWALIAANCVGFVGMQLDATKAWCARNAMVSAHSIFRAGR